MGIRNKIIRNKIKSQKGESIAEVLAAMVIVALASVLFATMIIASERIIKKSDTSYSQYLGERNAINEVDAKNADPSGVSSRKNAIKISKIRTNDNSYQRLNISANAEQPIQLYQNSVSEEDKKNGTKSRLFIYMPVADNNSEAEEQ